MGIQSGGGVGVEGSKHWEPLCYIEGKGKVTIGFKQLGWLNHIWFLAWRLCRFCAGCPCRSLGHRMATAEDQLRAIKLKLRSSRVDGEEIMAWEIFKRYDHQVSVFQWGEKRRGKSSQISGADE